VPYNHLENKKGEGGFRGRTVLGALKKKEPEEERKKNTVEEKGWQDRKPGKGGREEHLIEESYHKQYPLNSGIVRTEKNTWQGDRNSWWKKKRGRKKSQLLHGEGPVWLGTLRRGVLTSNKKVRAMAKVGGTIRKKEGAFQQEEKQGKRLKGTSIPKRGLK